MTAALIQPRHRYDGLQPTRLTRDLAQIADLIEFCFSDQMDSGGRAAVQEMKFVAAIGPLLWLFALLGLKDQYGLGYVWREQRRVVGNASLFPAGVHPTLGRGWLVANVAVDPDFRRRGIALAMMEAVIAQACKKGNWLLLQVESDNPGAIKLYNRLGFEQFETLGQWKSRNAIAVPSVPDNIWQVRQRRFSDGQAELDLIFNRARRGGMSWTRPLNRSSVLGGWLSSIDEFLEGPSAERLVMEDPLHPGRLLGSAWIRMSGWQQSRITLYLDPELNDPAGRLALLYRSLQHPFLERRMVNIEIEGKDGIVEEALRAAGFVETRSLMQMRKILQPELIGLSNHEL